MNTLIRLLCLIVTCDEGFKFTTTRQLSKDIADIPKINRINENPNRTQWSNEELEIIDNVKVLLYTNNNTITPYEMNIFNTISAPINMDCPLELIIHGWGGDSSLEWVHTIKDELLILDCHNVMIIDWGVYSLDIIYINSVMKIPEIENIRIRGFSLGAHVAGYIGKTIYEQTGLKLSRITGMDPAGIFFQRVPPENRLSKDDALFVDVIHTCGRVFGLMKQIGHADFYPNSGILQNCFAICSHKRSYQYFIESISSANFLSTPCTTWRKFILGRCKKAKRVSMGYHLDTKAAKGRYFLYVNKNFPFARG